MVDFNDYDILKERRCTLKEASYDDANKKYMTESNTEVSKFDDIVKWHTDHSAEQHDFAKGNDALLFNMSEFLFIEFKNGRVKKSKVELKNEDSLKALKHFCHNSIDDSYIKEHGKYMLVYNYDAMTDEQRKEAENALGKNDVNQSNAREFLRGRFRALAGHPVKMLFQLESIAELYAEAATMEMREFNLIVDSVSPLGWSSYFL